MEPDWPPNDAAVGIRRERRAVERLQVYRGVLLSIPGHLTAQSCLVRDFSLRGAGIRITGIALLPLQFDLSFDGFRITEACLLIWRNGDFAGLAFPSLMKSRPSDLLNQM